MAWGFWNRTTGKFERYYDICYETTVPQEGLHLWIFDSELEAVAEWECRYYQAIHDIRVKYYKISDLEVMELPADEPEWVFFDD